MYKISPSEARAKASIIREQASKLNDELTKLQNVKSQLDTAWKDNTELRNSEIYKEALVSQEQKIRGMITRFDNLANTFENLANDIEQIKIKGVQE